MEEKEQKPEAVQIASAEIARILKNENAVKLITKEINQYLEHLEGITKNFKVIIKTINDFFHEESIHGQTT